MTTPKSLTQPYLTLSHSTPCSLTSHQLAPQLPEVTEVTTGKEPACQCRSHKRHGFDPWVGKIPWRRAWQPTPVFLPGESHGQRCWLAYSPWCDKESDMTEVTECARVHTHTEHAVCKRLRQMRKHKLTAETHISKRLCPRFQCSLFKMFWKLEFFV